MKSIKPLYYRYIEENGYGFTKNKIYKIKNPNNLESFSNFLDDKGSWSGWSGENYKKFVPATEQEWNTQEGIN